MFDLPTIWAGLLALSIFIYVILDGFDLGIGIIFPFLKTDKCRDVAMKTSPSRSLPSPFSPCLILSNATVLVR